MASPGKRHCANCIGALSFRMLINETERSRTDLRTRPLAKIRSDPKFYYVLKAPTRPECR